MLASTGNDTFMFDQGKALAIVGAWTYRQKVMGNLTISDAFHDEIVCVAQAEV